MANKIAEFGHGTNQKSSSNLQFENLPELWLILDKVDIPSVLLNPLVTCSSYKVSISLKRSFTDPLLILKKLDFIVRFHHIFYLIIHYGIQLGTLFFPFDLVMWRICMKKSNWEQFRTKVKFLKWLEKTNWEQIRSNLELSFSSKNPIGNSFEPTFNVRNNSKTPIGNTFLILFVNKNFIFEVWNAVQNS